MRLARSLVPLAALLALVAAVGAAPAGEALDGPTVQHGLRSDPCSFYRGQAYGRGLEHFSTEMLWACEAIAARRAAEMELSERLHAVERALERYRQALVAEGGAAFARSRIGPPRSVALGPGDAVKAALAETSGALEALATVRSGF
jgi:hypothetical protein